VVKYSLSVVKYVQIFNGWILVLIGWILVLIKYCFRKYRVETNYEKLPLAKRDPWKIREKRVHKRFPDAFRI